MMIYRSIPNITPKPPLLHVRDWKLELVNSRLWNAVHEHLMKEKVDAENPDEVSLVVRLM
jgi:hypothetical protein